MSIYKAGRPRKYNPATQFGKRPPDRAGEYRIRDGSRTITYIGETCNLNRRMGEHVRSGKLPRGSTLEYKVADGRSSSGTRRQHEQTKIKQHHPILNRSKGGEGRPAGKKSRRGFYFERDAAHSCFSVNRENGRESARRHSP